MKEFSTELCVVNDSVDVVDDVVSKITLDYAISEYVESIKMNTSFKDKSLIDIFNRLKWLELMLGSDKLVSDIKKGDMNNFFRLLKDMPANRAAKKNFSGKTVDELLAMDIKAEDKLSVSSKNSIIETVRQFYSYCVWNGYMKNNLAENIS